MQRDDSTNIEHAGQDSFLDITTNIVGILIILVMVVGMRAQNPIVQESTTPVPTAEELGSLSKQAATIEYDVRRMGQQMEALDQDSSAKSTARESLATLIAAAEKELGDRRAQFDSSKQEDFDLRRQVEQSLAALDRGEAELKDLESQKPPIQEVRHYPTPISRMVLGHEVHFQLLGGRIAYVPIDDFVDDVRSNLRTSGMDLNNIADRVGVVGPRNGFEFRYTMDTVSDRGRIVGLRAKEFQIVPAGMQEGETFEKAMLPNSDFHRALAMHSPHDTTITMWTYPDSFELYRQLKEELHRLDFATAGRPLPMGVLIGGSDHGTKSSAQ
ncbi:MAG TPA: hypothetical protein VFE46_17480 [Pirellulales bacterium]|jgi:hypothetical protein|nr:hypothetical protein [Pirellulales bacterium]